MLVLPSVPQVESYSAEDAEVTALQDYPVLPRMTYLVLRNVPQIESYTAEDAEVIALQDEAERERLRNDPLYRLEHGEKAKVQV